MSTMTTPTVQRAIKRHACAWCSEAIVIGEQYKRYRHFSHGDAGTVKMHTECFGAMQEAADDEGGWIEWTPGDFERPAKGAA